MIGFMSLKQGDWPAFSTGLVHNFRPRLLVVEGRPLHCTHFDRVRVEAVELKRIPRCFHCRDCFRLNYDIVVPSFTDCFVHGGLRMGGFGD